MNAILRFSAGCLFVGILTLASGCGEGKLSRSKISGVVTYKSAPVKGGNMTLSNDIGGTYTTSIQEDGTYSISDVPTGNYSVTIETDSLNPEKKAAKGATGDKGGAREKMQSDYMKAMGKGSGGSGEPGTGPSKEELAKRYTKIPAKYSNKALAGLQVDVVLGVTLKDFVLVD